MSTTKFVTGFVLAAAIAAAGSIGPASAQSADDIRAKCIGLAGNNALLGNTEDNRSRARVELYITCMQQHGLQP
jgi:hypothetical protein